MTEIDESEAFAATSRMKTWALIVVLAGGLVIILFGVLLAGSITRPFLKAVEFAGRIGDGDLSRRMNVARGDELGQLSRTLGEMADALETKDNEIRKSLMDMELVLQEVATVSGQVSIGADQVSDAGQALSQGATEQAASLEEISSSMTQIAAQTQINAEHAGQADRLSESTREAADQGAAQMRKMVRAMTDINRSSQEIDKIIKTIDDIAFQTNLLALNAAVEAARAGKQGKGFAVVAQEVRNLAGRSAKAAQETSELIDGAVREAQKGMEIVNGTSESLDQIIYGIQKMSDPVGEIAAASNEQAHGVSQVTQGLDQIEQVTQQNTASAEQTAAAAEELSGQSGQLQDLLVRFKGDGPMTDSPVRPALPKQLPQAGDGNGRSWGGVDGSKDAPPVKVSRDFGLRTGK